MNFLNALNCFKQDNVISAQRAVDFYEGDQTRLLKQALARKGYGIKDYDERGVMALWINYTRKIIQRSAHTYDQQPTREIYNGETLNETETEIYNQILEDAEIHFVSQDLDERVRLLKSAGVLIQWVEEEQRYNLHVLAQNNCDVEYDTLTGTVKSIMYTTCDAGFNGGQEFRHITPETITEFEYVQNEKEDVIKGRTEIENPYGIVPFVPIFDIRQPSYGFFHKPAWEELTQFNEAINFFNTEAKFGSRFSLVGMPVTNAKIAKGSVMGPDNPIMLEMDDPETPVFFEFRAPTTTIEEWLKWVQDLSSAIGDSWGVTLDPDGDGAADSGFKLIVRELPNTELRQTRRRSAARFEKLLFNAMRIMWAIDMPSAAQFRPDSTITVEFNAPLLAINKKEDWDIAKEQLAAGVLSRRDYLKMSHPEWSDDEIAQALADIDADRQPVTVAPQFGE